MKIKQNKMQWAVKGFAVLLIIGGISCSKSKKTETVAEQLPVEEVELIEEDIWIIEEHKVNDIPITSHGKKELAEQDGVDAETIDSEAVAEMEEMQAEMEDVKSGELYDIYTMGVIDPMLQEEDLAQVEVVEAVIPLEETQTITAYSKKGEEIAELQVVSGGSDNEIEHIVFTDKKHTDVYDVQVGMTGKEVKNLRKELKHMVKKGQVFLYHDDSNIMYLMDAQDIEGNEIAEADIVNMEVDAIIWKDKKHHKKKG